MPEIIKQFEKVKRSLEKIEDQDRGSNRYDDDMWHFFQDCHHLKDWIINDPSVPTAIKGADGYKVENYIDSNIELIICANLANRSKHGKLTGRRKETDARVTNHSVTIEVPALHIELDRDRKNIIKSYSDSTGKTTQELTITIYDGRKYKALEVARTAVQLWEKFLSDNGLL
jgi:hypothetical protein